MVTSVILTWGAIINAIMYGYKIGQDHSVLHIEGLIVLVLMGFAAFNND